MIPFPPLRLPIFLWRLCDVMRAGNARAFAAGAALRGRIEVRAGTGNRVEFGPGAQMRGGIVFDGDGNRAILEEGASFIGRILIKGEGQTVRIGRFTTAAGVQILCQEGCDVTIGASCMLSREVEIRTTDAHSVVDRRTQLRINPPGSVEIGDHVWIGMRAVIGKGARVPTDCVVGAMSFVNRAHAQEGVVLAGVPARPVREGVTWNRGRRPAYSRRRLEAWRAGARG